MRRPFSFGVGLGLWLALAGFGLAPPAHATTVRALTLAEKTALSDLVIHAVVKSVEVRWQTPGRRTETVVTFQVLESLKGDFAPGQTVVMRRGGGRIGDFDLRAPGLSEYAPEEEVVMFLSPLGDRYVAVGIGIGKYAVRTRDGQKWVEHAPAVTGARIDPQGRTVLQPIPPMQPTLLSDFLAEVRRIAAVPGSGRRLKARPTIRDLGPVRAPEGIDP